MKFRDPKTGEVYENIHRAKLVYCDSKEINCFDCGLSNYNNKYKELCDEFCKNHKKEAAEIMGYEIIEDEEISEEAKADAGKPRPTLVPVSLINAVTAVREYGCKKYHDPENWSKVDKQRYKDAAYRHWLKYIDGEENDDESGLPHLWHLACNVAFLIEMEGK